MDQTGQTLIEIWCGVWHDRNAKSTRSKIRNSECFIQEHGQTGE